MIPAPQDRLFLCWRYHAWEDMDYDPEMIWAFVQRHGGYISVQAAGSLDFYLAPEYHAWFTLAFPLLRRIEANDLL